MGLFDIFKKKKPVEPKKLEKKISKPAPAKPGPKQRKRPLKGDAFEILLEPHITEKATDFEKENKYIFKVFPKANKIEVKRAVESLYGVNVENVNIINIPRKKRRARTRREGWRKGYKKAIVKIAKDQKIEVMPR